MWSLPLRTVATLAAGLDGDSRIKRKITGSRLKLDSLLIAALVDRVSVLAWRQTRNGQRGIKPPESVVSVLLSPPREKQETSLVFDSPEAFEAARAKALKEAQHAE